MTFDAIPGSVQELDCVLVFDEETKASSSVDDVWLGIQLMLTRLVDLHT